MILFLVALALALLALPGVARPLGKRLEPRRWARLVAAGLLGGVALFELAVVLETVPSALGAVGLTELARACHRMLGSLEPGGLWLTLLAAGLAVVIPLRFWRAVSSARGVSRWARAGAGLGSHRHLPCGAELVVLPTLEPVAVSLPGQPDQIVVSASVKASLSPAEFDLLCCHESAHLRFGHSRYLEIALAVERTFRWWPGARLSAKALRVALERWADEEAAGPGAARREVLREALLSVVCIDMPNELAAFSGGAGLLERLDALVAPPSTVSLVRRGLFLLPGAFLGAFAAYGIGSWGHAAFCMIQMASRCTGS